MKRDIATELRRVEKKAQSLHHTLLLLNMLFKKEGIQVVEGLGALFVLDKLAQLVPVMVRFLGYFGYHVVTETKVETKVKKKPAIPQKGAE